MGPHLKKFLRRQKDMRRSEVRVDTKLYKTFESRADRLLSLGKLSMKNTDCTTMCHGLKAHCLAQNVRNQMSWFSISDMKQTRWSCFLTFFLLPTWPRSRHITRLLTWTLSSPISDSSPCYGVRGFRSRFMMSALREIASMNGCVNSGKCLSL